MRPARWHTAHDLPVRLAPGQRERPRVASRGRGGIPIHATIANRVQTRIRSRIHPSPCLCASVRDLLFLLTEARRHGDRLPRGTGSLSNRRVAHGPVAAR